MEHTCTTAEPKVDDVNTGRAPIVDMVADKGHNLLRDIFKK